MIKKVWIMYDSKSVNNVWFKKCEQCMIQKVWIMYDSKSVNNVWFKKCE